MLYLISIGLLGKKQCYFDSLLLNMVFGLYWALLPVQYLFYCYAKKSASRLIHCLEESQEKLRNAKREIENEKREALLKVKDEIYKKRNEFEFEMKRDRSEIDRMQAKLMRIMKR